MLNCIYHPTQKMRVVEDDVYEELLATGVWFKTSKEAKEMRETYEKQILKRKRKGDAELK